jgi:hypothetical protein
MSLIDHLGQFPAGMNRKDFFKSARRYCKHHNLVYDGFAKAAWEEYDQRQAADDDDSEDEQPPAASPAQMQQAAFDAARAEITLQAQQEIAARDQKLAEQERMMAVIQQQMQQMQHAAQSAQSAQTAAPSESGVSVANTVVEMVKYELQVPQAVAAGTRYAQKAPSSLAASVAHLRDETRISEGMVFRYLGSQKPWFSVAKEYGMPQKEAKAAMLSEAIAGELKKSEYRVVDKMGNRAYLLSEDSSKKVALLMLGTMSVLDAMKRGHASRSLDPVLEDDADSVVGGAAAMRI